MTEARRQARIAMLRQRKTFADVATQTGLSLATVHAALSNTCVSVKVHRAIVNALQVELWGLRPTERYLHVPSSWGMQIEFQTKKEALDAVAELGGVITRRGRTITFVKPVTFVVEIPPEESQSAKNRKISSHSIE